MPKDDTNITNINTRSIVIDRSDKFQYFAAFITATDIEFESLYKLYSWKQLYISDTGYYYYETSIKRNSKNLKILLTRQNNMGMIAATRTATNIIWQFSPQYVVMVGICAGIKNKDNDDLILGDIVLADKIWNCSAGKYVNNKNAPIQLGKVGFVPSPQTIKVPHEVISVFENAISSDNCTYPVHIGTITSSMTVIADIEIVENQIKSQSSNTIALDMESYGIAYACQIESQYKPTPIIVKAICDFASSDKNYDYQRYASANSAKFTKLLLEEFLPAN